MTSKLSIFQTMLFLMVCCGGIYAGQNKDYSPFPNPDAGYVTDNAGLLTKEQKKEIQDWLYTCEKRTGIEFAVVTINSIKDYPGAPNENIEEFAKALFDKYGIGNMPKNNGVLLLIAAKDRKARIELGAAYGHARDSDATRIMQNVIIPQFKNNDYASGIRLGVKAMIREFAGVTIIPGYINIIVAGAAIIAILSAISLFRNGKRGWGWVFVGLGIVLILAFLKLFSGRIESSSGNYGGGFGGGSSGGGGATGSW